MPYNFSINDFEGPLDLLLHLVKQSKMDIYEININDIILEYLDFIKTMEDLNIDIASEYLVMASTLVHLKSRLLINKEEESSEEENEFDINSEEELRKKIIEYEQVKNITASFKELEQKRSEVYTKIPDNLKEYQENIPLAKNITLNDLYQAIINFKERQKYAKPLNTKITKKEISIEKRTIEIRNILKLRKKVNFIELFEEPTKDYIIATFLSILNMSKNKELIIYQTDNFSPIMIEGVLNE